jgi:hypothetical protein
MYASKEAVINAARLRARAFAQLYGYGLSKIFADAAFLSLYEKTARGIKDLEIRDSKKTKTGKTGAETPALRKDTTYLEARVLNLYKTDPFQAVYFLSRFLNNPTTADKTHKLALKIADELYGVLYERGKYDMVMRDAAQMLELVLYSVPEHHERAYATSFAFSLASLPYDNAPASTNVSIDIPDADANKWDTVTAGAAIHAANDDHHWVTKNYAHGTIQ